MEVSEVKDRILKVDPEFGKKCLDYLGRLEAGDLNVVRLVSGLPSPAIRVVKVLPHELRLRYNTHYAWEPGQFNMGPILFGFSIGSVDERTESRDGLGIYFSKDGVYTHYGNRIDNGALLKLNAHFLEESLKTYESLFH